MKTNIFANILIRCILIAIGMTCGRMSGQGLTFSSISLDVNEGLSSSVTFGMARDERGFMWIATSQGVDRYDGHIIKPYSLTQNTDGVKQLNDGKQHHLITDKEGDVYCYTDRGRIFRYDKTSDRFELSHSVTHLLDRHSLHAISLSNNLMLVGVYNGLYVLDTDGVGSTRHFMQGINVHCITEFDAERHLVGSDRGIQLLDIGNNRCEAFACEDLEVKSLYYDQRHNRLWVGTNGSGLWFIDLSNGRKWQEPKLTTSIINDIKPYGDSHMLVATDGQGLLVASTYDENADMTKLATDESDSPYQLPAGGIQSLLVDEGNIWIATWGGGVTLLKASSMFRCIANTEASSPADLRTNDVCFDHNGHLWIAYNRAIAEYNLETGETRIFHNRRANFLSVKAASDGSIWCAGYNSGLYRLDPKRGIFDHMASIDGSTVNNSIYSLFIDKDENLWIGGLFTSMASMPLTGSHGFPDRRTVKSYDISRINDINQLSDSVMLAATANGIVMLDRHDGSTATLFSESDTATWTGVNYFSSIIADSHGNIYGATDGSGLVIYDTRAHTYINYNTRDGFPSNHLRGMVMQGDSLLWISTDGKGIFSFNLRQKRVQSRLTRNSGLTSLEYFNHASAISGDNRLVFGGRSGAELINSNAIDQTIDNVQIMLDEPQLDADVVQLSYRDRSLRLSFTTNDLYHQNDVQMEYRIDEGYQAWQQLDNNRTLTLYSLPAGNHQLTVRSLGAGGVIAEKIIRLEVEQTPWLSWQAILCYAALLCLLIVAAVITYIKHTENVAAAEKISFFNSVAHDIRTPLSLVATPLTDLEQYVNDDIPPTLLPLIKRNLQHLRDIVDQLSLFNSNQQSGKQMNIEPILLNSFIASLAEAYEPVAIHSGLKLSVSMPDNDVWVKADLQTLTRICDNLLGNALKYTKQGEVKIRLMQNSGRGIIEVRDTGIGMSHSTMRKLFRHFFRGENAIAAKIPGLGLGLMYSYQATVRMQGHLTCRSAEGKGSTFTLWLPQSAPGEIQKYSAVMHEAAIDEDSRALYSGYRYNILLVEDNPELLNYMQHKLEKGYNVTTANCVADAQQLLDENSTDLILTDVMMPGMHGDEWCRQLKSNIATSHIPVIILTAKTSKDSQMEGLSAGADDYITKPFDMNMLLIKIMNMFDARQRLRTHYMQLMQQESAKSTEETRRELETKATQSSLDDQFVARLMQVLDKNIGNASLLVDDIAGEMAMSHTLFYEKVNKLLGMPPASLIRQCRMKKGKALLLEGGHTVNEVAMMCGFTDAKYFSTCFKKFYGVLPSKIE